MSALRPLTLMVVCAFMGVLGLDRAQAQSGTPRHWTFRTRLAMSGSSDHSDPAGFTIFSGVAIETALSRDLGRRTAVELGLRNESREVDREVAPASRERLGSLELLPITATVQFRPGDPGGTRRFRPYLGAGGSLTVAWEKSGVLDSLDVGAHVGPVVQMGGDLGLGPGVMLNLEARWQTQVIAIEGADRRYARLRVHPVTIGIGLGFRF